MVEEYETEVEDNAPSVAASWNSRRDLHRRLTHELQRRPAMTTTADELYSATVCLVSAISRRRSPFFCLKQPLLLLSIFQPLSQLHAATGVPCRR
ncbi:hypothetical protein PIB30_020020 [Stylosanthes scabra]|uniref:Uncharacterized protein n=1 Tax=Stylosanthes scabra TaxID=79078 RepID=A0ABU6R8P4_9FABA|nr:hypothetical protein [Stylosanthes scabra]